jgi:hypothetical protein
MIGFWNLHAVTAEQGNDQMRLAQRQQWLLTF